MRGSYFGIQIGQRGLVLGFQFLGGNRSAAKLLNQIGRVGDLALQVFDLGAKGAHGLGVLLLSGSSVLSHQRLKLLGQQVVLLH